jgi:uncharacterized protein YodC (DUF2158 family)
MADELKVGEVVQLKSGGPQMTIDQIISGGKARWVWFEGPKRSEDVFALATLMKPDSPKG